MYEAGNGYTIRVHKVKAILGIWMCTVTRGFHCSHDSVHEINFMN